ncbi:hypothetical protein [Kamptonema formosum]|nr:hypothetical protein [Oscillatoria sp. PCC 10802]
MPHAEADPSEDRYTPSVGSAKICTVAKISGVFWLRSAERQSAVDGHC